MDLFKLVDLYIWDDLTVVFIRNLEGVFKIFNEKLYSFVRLAWLRLSSYLYFACVLITLYQNEGLRAFYGALVIETRFLRLGQMAILIALHARSLLYNHSWHQTLASHRL